MKIVVLGGCGDMGSYVVRDLAANSDANVVIADYRLPKAQKLAAELGGRASAAFVDANDEASLAGVLQGADAAVGCIGPFYHFAPKMARAASRPASTTWTSAMTTGQCRRSSPWTRRRSR
jgi:saccharopine dehydrogenase-like NADP-dependent oxidoreductase